MYSDDVILDRKWKEGRKGRVKCPAARIKSALELCNTFLGLNRLNKENIRLTRGIYRIIEIVLLCTSNCHIMRLRAHNHIIYTYSPLSSKADIMDKLCYLLQSHVN